MNISEETTETPKKTINPIRYIGGGLLLISALFLSWVEIPFVGSLKLLNIYRTTHTVSEMAKGFGVESFSAAGGLILVVFGLILIAGIVSAFKPKAGGVVGIIGMILATIIVIGAGKELSDSDSLFPYLASGYYVAWAGAILCLFSNKIYNT